MGENVPCYTEFYKYIQWHNHAGRILANYNGHHENINVFTLHYEDFLNNFDGAVEEVLKFSALPRVNKSKELFFERYDYYTKEKISEFINTLANDATSSILDVYNLKTSEKTS